MTEKPFTQATIDENSIVPAVNTQVDKFMTNFKGGNKLQRGGGWDLKGGGSNTASFLSSGSVVTDQTPALNNVYALGNASFKWSNIAVVLINGATPKAGTNTYYVAGSSGGSPTTALTFIGGILT